jgi:hypothetical protein
VTEPQERGYEKVGENGPLTKYVKKAEDSRMVAYHTPEGTVRVNEGARTPNVAHGSPDFFWTPIKQGLLHENERVETVEEAHELAQEKIETLISNPDQ